MRDLITLLENIERTHLETLVRIIRDHAVAEFGIESLEGNCEGIARDLRDEMRREGIPGRFVFGRYLKPHTWPDGDTTPYVGHCWIETEQFILDPSREQFGSNDLVIPKTSVEAKLYIEDSQGEWDED